MIDFPKNSPHGDIINTMIEIHFPEGCEATGMRVSRETLRRIGIPSYSKNGKNALFQSCHILKKRGRYYLCHFKQMLALDGKAIKIPDLDLARLYQVAYLLVKWGLCEADHTIEPRKVPLRVVKYNDQENWLLFPKHKLGTKRGNV